jgi:protein-tyrosine-phosphatase
MAAVRVLSVCTHNRTRSVLMGALLTHHMNRTLVPGAVRAAGFQEPGHPPTPQTIQLLAAQDIDVATYTSRRVTHDDVHAADVIVTAERMHVVEIAGRWPGSFAKSMTLPELVMRGAGTHVGPDGDIAQWLEQISVARPIELDYLDADDIGEIADPTGMPPAVWRSSFEQIDTLTSAMATMLTPHPIGAR